MRVFKRENYTLHYRYGESTIIIMRTNQNWRGRCIPRDDVCDCQRKCEPLVKSSLSHLQKWVHSPWRLNTALWRLREHSRIVQRCQISAKPQFLFFEFVGTINYIILMKEIQFLLMQWVKSPAVQWAQDRVYSSSTAASHNLASYDNFLVRKSLAASGIFQGQCQATP